MRTPSTRAYIAAFLASLALYTVLAIGHSMTRRPWTDEGVMAAPAVSLVKTGVAGTIVWESAGADQPDGTGQSKGVHEHTYYNPPLFFLMQALWYRIFPPSLLAMRMLSVLWGYALIAATVVITRRVTGDARTALGAGCLLALDYTVLSGASFGRMDMTSAALGYCGLASYLALRERRLMPAVLTANSLVAASMLTHPIGVCHAFALLGLGLYLDRKRIRAGLIFAAAFPYLAGGALYGLYILQSPADFLTQFRTNAVGGDRLIGFYQPWKALWWEITRRYVFGFGLGSHSAGNVGPIFLKALILAAYVAGVAGCVLIKSIRQLRETRILLLLLSVYWVAIALIDSQKGPYYLVHIIPIYVVLLTLFARWCFQNGKIPKGLAIVGLLGLVALQTAGIAYKIKLNTYRTTYLEAVQYLKSHMAPGDFVIGSADLAFELGFFQERFVDDTRLGYFSGRKPAYIVIEEAYEVTLAGHKLHRPKVAAFVAKRLSEEYVLVYDRNHYKIYKRRPEA